MTLLAAMGIFSLGLVAVRVCKSWWFPPSLFCFYWTLILIACTLANFWHYSLTVQANLVFVVGCASFLCGGLLAVHFFPGGLVSNTPDGMRIQFVRRLVMVGSVVVILTAPLYLASLSNAAAQQGIDNSLSGYRYLLKSPDRGGVPRIYSSIGSIGMALAFCAAWLHAAHRRALGTLLLAVTGSLLMSVLSSSRTNVFTLLIGVVGILAVGGRVRTRSLGVFIFVTAGITSGMGLMMDKVPGFEFGVHGLRPLAESLAIYFVGGPLGFANVMDLASSVGEPGLSLRFFLQPLQSVGLSIELPPLILGYFSSELGNVYTMYFAYWLDGGWLGVILVSMLAGLFCTLIALLARRGSAIGGLGMGYVIPALLNSATGDGIFYSATHWLVLVGVTLLTWYFPLRGIEVRPAAGTVLDNRHS